MWNELTSREQASCRALVRIAARRAALGRPWDPICINVPHLLGMPAEEIRRVWRETVARACHLTALFGASEAEHEEV